MIRQHVAGVSEYPDRVALASGGHFLAASGADNVIVRLIRWLEIRKEGNFTAQGENNATLIDN